MKLEQAENFLRRKAERLKKAVQRAEDRSAKRGLQIARYCSSGMLKMGKGPMSRLHPFAKRHGTPLADVQTINKQSGNFRDSWRVGYVYRLNINEPVIRNISPYAKYLQKGTRYMFARPVDERIKAILMPIRMTNLRSELAQLEINLK